MSTESQLESALVEEFDRHNDRTDGATVVASLQNGLSVCRRKLMHRVHEDVETEFGVDSFVRLQGASTLLIRRREHHLPMHHRHRHHHRLP